MRDNYWSLLVEIKTAERYYWHYRIHSNNRLNVINAFFCITSCASIASWLIWDELYVLWAIIIGISQLASAIRHLFPYASRVSSINYLLPELSVLLCEMEHDWPNVEKYDDTHKLEKINNLIYKYKTEYQRIENKYTGNTTFPTKKRLCEKADTDRILYFYQRFNIKEYETMEESICLQSHLLPKGIKAVTKTPETQSANLNQK